jgi:methylenetetrahydrofolate dehydrogenase (NADP+)/methenyltetrahydrofolate cyclohydrolase/formyltetrahydrofolate synthetase
MSNHWAEGGKGAVELGKAVMAACEKPSRLQVPLPAGISIKEKIETIAREIYGGDGVEYSEKAEEQIADYNRLGFDKLPICMAKTHLSLSHDPNLKGARPASRCRFGRFAPASVRVSSTRWWAR